jgi:hypothetical protein
MKSIYLCGAMAGCSDQECKDWRDYATEKLKDRFNLLNPMNRDYRGINTYTEEQLKDIVEGDKRDIDNSEYVLCYYTKPSVGTSMELLYSWERGKYNIVVTNGQKISPWLIYHSHHVCESLDEALELFNR